MYAMCMLAQVAVFLVVYHRHVEFSTLCFYLLHPLQDHSSNRRIFFALNYIWNSWLRLVPFANQFVFGVAGFLDRIWSSAHIKHRIRSLQNSGSHEPTLSFQKMFIAQNPVYHFFDHLGLQYLLNFHNVRFISACDVKLRELVAFHLYLL